MHKDAPAAAVPAPEPAPRVRGRALGWVAVCIVASGFLTYGYLALVARALPVADYGWFGSYWSLALVVGFGAFLPVELELARLVQQRPPGAALPRGTVPTLLALTAATAVALLLAGPRLAAALGERTGFLFALLCICGISVGQFLLRGLLLGTGRLGLHGGVLLVDSGLRVALAAALAWSAPGARGDDYAWTLVAAMGLAHLPLLAWLLVRRGGRRPAPPDDPPAGVFVRAVGHLLVGSLCAQVLLNAAPVVITALAGPGEEVRAAQFVASYTLVRLPLFVAVPLQSAMIPLLVQLRADPDAGRLAGLVRRGLVAIVLLGAAAAAVGWWLGPAVVRLVFGAAYALPGDDIAVLAVGSVLHLGLLVAGQALVAAGRHRAVAVVWLTGLAAACICFAVVPDLVLRSALAFTLGSAVALTAAAVALLRDRTTPATGAPVPAPEGPSA
ncbi:lipopolysaccharide biosynthesis protein [Modestobacter sp. SYSU DS0657]